MTSPGGYSAGTIFLQVVPSFKGFQDAVRKEAKAADRAFGDEQKKAEPKAKAAAEKRGKEEAEAYAGKFRETLKRSIQQTQREIASIKIDVDVDDAQDRLATVAKYLDDLKDREIGVDIDADAALDDLIGMRTELEAIQALSDDLTIDVEVDLGAGIAQLKAMEAEVEKFSRETEALVKVELDRGTRGRFSRDLRRAVEQAADALPDIPLDADATAAQREIALIRGQLLALRDEDLTVGVDGTRARAEIARLEADLRRIAAENPEIDIKVDALAASAELRKIAGQAEALDGKTIDIDVDTRGLKKLKADLNDGGNSLRAFSGIALGVAALGPLVVPALAAMAAGAVGLGTAFLGAAAGVGVLILAFNGIGDAVSAMNAAEKDSDQIAIRRRNSANAVADATRNAEDAERSYARAVRDAAQANEDAARRVEQARQAVVEAERDAADGVASALERQADARQNLADTVRENARRAEDAAQAVADAEERLADVVEDAQRRQERAADAVERARENVADATERAADLVERALDRQADAERRLTDAVRDATRAQEDLIEARSEAADDLEDIDNRVESGRLREEGAILDLEESLIRLNELRADPEATALQIAQAENAYQQQLQAFDELVLQNQRLREEQAEAHAEGVEGSDRVKSATERLNDATLAQVEAQEAVTEATEEAAEAQVDAITMVAEAEEALADATTEYSRVRRENREAIRDAELEINEAIERQGEVLADNARRSAEADEQQREAAAGVAQAHEDGAARIIDAQLDVEDALRSAERTQVQGAESVEDAQRRVEDSMRAVQRAAQVAGEEGSASLRKVEDAMRALSPAGQEFALFLVGLKPLFDELTAAAQEGLLPGLQSAIETLITAFGPGFVTFVGDMATAIGDFFLLAAETFTSPLWREFFDMFAEAGPTFLTLFGEIGLSILTIFSQLAVAFAPLATQMLEGLLALTTGFSDFLASPEGKDALTQFFGYIEEVAPLLMEFFGALGGALLNLAIGLAPYAGVLLQILTGFLNFIAGLPPGVLGAVALGLLAMVLAVQTLLGVVGILATIFSAVTAGVALATIGMVAAGIGAFVAFGAAFVILWTQSETFRDIVKGVFGAVGAAVDFLWERVVKPLFRLIGEAFEALADGFETVWRNVFEPVLDALGDLITYMWENVVSPLFRLIGEAFGLLAEVIGAYWRNVLSPVFGAIIAVITFLWENVASPLFRVIGEAFGAMAGVIDGLFRNVLDPVLQLMIAIITFLWENVGRPIFQNIADAFARMGEGIRYIYDLYIRPIINAFVGIMQDHLQPIFESVVDAIGRAWDRLVELARTPIKFVVDTVLNNGLIAAFNQLADFFGTDQIPRINLPASFYGEQPRSDQRGGVQQFAEGGMIPGFSPTPTADNIPAMLTAGEYVLPVRAVANLRAMYGDQFLEWLRKGGSAYAQGGLVEFGRLLQSRKFRVSEHPSFGGVNGKHAEGSFHYKGQAIDVNYGPGGESDVEKAAIDAIIGLAGQYGLRTIWRTAGHFNHAHFDTAGPGSDMIGGGGGGFLSGLVDFVGNAIDKPLEWMGDKVRGVFGILRDSAFGGLLIGGVEKLLDAAVSTVSGAMGSVGDFFKPDGEATPRGYAGGGPVLYDAGGALPPGMTTVVNASGRPEQILTAAQWDALLDRAAGGGAGGGEFRGTLYLDNGAFVGEVRGVMAEEQRTQRQLARGRMG